MTKDFRAKQIQTSQIISSGSSGTGAKIVVYDISGQDQANLNQGIVDSATFNISSIGTDIFLYVSGTKAETFVAATNPQISVFGGDITASGSVVAKQGLLVSSPVLTEPLNDFQLIGTGETRNVFGLPYDGRVVSRNSENTSWIKLIGFRPFLINESFANTLIIGDEGVSASLIITNSGSVFSALELNAYSGSRAIVEEFAIISSGSEHARDVGSNVFFYVSGTINSWTTASLVGPKKHSVFGGDVRVSGSFIGGGGHSVNESFTGGPTGTGSLAQFNGILAGVSHSINAGFFDFQSFQIVDVPTDRNFFGAGEQNTFTAGSDSGIVAGRNNTIETDYVSASSFIGAGESNSIYAGYSGLVAGKQNFISSESSSSFIGAGEINSISGMKSAIVGGDTNQMAINSNMGFIGGGYNNTIATFADTEFEAILVGSGNLIQGDSVAGSTDYSVILGGKSNNIAQTGSLLYGYNLTSSNAEGPTVQFGSRTASHDYRFVVSASRGSVFHGGLSGSLTTLEDGSSYLLAGTNITLSTGSNGAVTIAAASGGAADADWVDLGNAINTTSSVSISGDGLAASSHGTDVYFYVSGTKRDGVTDPIISVNALFDGNSIFSGTMEGKQGLILGSPFLPDPGTNNMQKGGAGSGANTSNVLGFPYGSEIVARTSGNIEWSPIIQYKDSVIDASPNALILGSAASSSLVLAHSGATIEGIIIVPNGGGQGFFANNGFAFGGEVAGVLAGPTGFGTDNYFYVSGTATTGSSTDKVAVFGGSVYISGNIYSEGLLQSRTPVRVVTALTSSLTEYDNGYILEGSNASDMLFIVPANLPVGVSVVLNPDTSGGQMVVSGASGVTLLAKASATVPLSTFEAYSPITVTMKTTGSAYVYGDLA